METYTESFPIQFAPIAEEKATVLGPKFRFAVLTPRLLRLEYSPSARFEDRPSQVFWYRQQPVPPFDIRRRESMVEIETEYLQLRYKPSIQGFASDSLTILLKESGESWQYGQKDPLNLWQATNTNLASAFDSKVDSIDWGDNLESVDWTIASQVRTEIVLYEDLTTPVTQYAMRHVDGWGISEVHGLQWDMQAGEPMYGVGTKATVYSHNARLTIQKLNVENLENLGTLTWEPKVGWTGADVNAPIFNMAVYQAGDGPGYYNAEINVKGKVIYGYTWKLKKLNDGVGYYRITFSFDDDMSSGYPLNTFFDADTGIIVAEEDEESGEEENNDTGGGIAHIDVANNLTYMDVYITEKQRGAGGGNGGGKTDNPGDGSGGGKEDNLGGGGNGNGNGKTR